MNQKNKKPISEFRRDLVSGEWILVSSLRGSRPHFFKAIKKEKEKFSIKNCPFEDPQKSGNPEPIIWFPHPNEGKKTRNKKTFKDWFVQVIPNKFPMFMPSKKCPPFSRCGSYRKINATGYHEVIIMRDHNKTLDKMSIEELGIVLRAYRHRYKMIEKDKCVEYVLIFHNEGSLAGASMAHPHSQLVALPIIPPDVSRSVSGGMNFYANNRKCVHCTMLKNELAEKKRIVKKNKYFATLCPYASRVSYETRIFPIKHSSDFEETTDEELKYLAMSLKDALMRISRVLKNPDYNFFIHTASAKVKNVPYYHWHIEILPRTYKWAGMELGTGIEVIVAPPEEAAKNLRKAI